jgi:large subunit ribosomal protein L6
VKYYLKFGNYMSRLAKKPIAIPAKVEIVINGENIAVKGPKGELSRDFKMDVIGIEKTEEGIALTKKKDDTFGQSLLGTYASHINNMIEGVTNGYEKKLILEGVGFRVAVAGKNLEMSLGFSHPVSVEIPQGLTITAEKNNVVIQGIDKELVGSFTASIRALKKPEPYKGKGFRYHDEIILRKQGKKSA